MPDIYYEVIYQHGSLIACLIGTIVIVSRATGILKRKGAGWIAGSMLVLTTVISAEFYPAQLSMLPINMIYPFTFLILFMHWVAMPDNKALIHALLIFHSLMLVLGLNLLSEAPNTWGDGGAIFGAFQVPNSALIVLYMSTQTDRTRYLSILKLLTGGLSLISIFLVTDIADEELIWPRANERMRNALLCASLFLVEGIVLIMPKSLIRLKKVSE